MCVVLSLNLGDKDDCHKTIEVMKRAKTASNNPSSTRSNSSARRIHRSPLTSDEAQPDQDREDESPLVLPTNENRSMGNTASPAPILPTATNDVSPHPTTG